MSETVWSTEEEARRLSERFVGVNQARFARDHRVPGGASMLSQHIKGRRPINLESALAYAAGFGVPLVEISPRLSLQARQAAASLRADGQRATTADAGRVPGAAAAAPGPGLTQALPVVLGALRGLSAAERTEMASRWAALLLAPDSVELQRWLAQALGAQEWDGLTERRSGNDRRRPSDPLPLKETPPRFAA